MSELLFNNQLIATLSYNVFENNEHYFVKADYGNGKVITDPYLIALSLFELHPKILNELKVNLEEKKVCQYYRKDIPYYEIFYTLTGGDDIWKSTEFNIKWNFDNALKFWKDDLDDLLHDCYTIYDLITVFIYFKNDLIVKTFPEFLRLFNEK